MATLLASLVGGRSTRALAVGHVALAYKPRDTLESVLMEWVTVLSSIFALVGGAMLIAAGREFTRRRAFVRGSALASGTIVGLTENREREEVSYFPKVKFRTPSGREVIFQSEIGSTSEAGRIGDTVTVRYRPDQPHLAELEGFLSLWGLTLLFSVLAVVFLFVGLGILVGFLPV